MVLNKSLTVLKDKSNFKTSIVKSNTYDTLNNSTMLLTFFWRALLSFPASQITIIGPATKKPTLIFSTEIQAIKFCNKTSKTTEQN